MGLSRAHVKVDGEHTAEEAIGLRSVVLEIQVAGCVQSGIRRSYETGITIFQRFSFVTKREFKNI